MKSTLPLVFAFVLVFAFGLMLFAFRSLVIAAKAILLNLLSVAAAYGVLVLVFQHGIGKGLLGFSSTAGIDPVVPLLLFVILFGLSMDYHVFILSRIREAFHAARRTDEAIAHGIKSTAGVVTSAAIVMVAVFAVFIDALDAVLQAVRRRARGGDPDRRDDRPRRAAARLDEAARRLELVPAEVARVAADARPRRATSPPPEDAARRRRPRTDPEAARSARGRSLPARVAGLLAPSGSPCSVSRTSGSRPADPVSVPAGAQGRRPDPRALRLRHRERQLRRRLRHARRAREPGRSAVAADRAAGDAHPGSLGAPGRARLPPPGRPGHHEHGLHRASRFADDRDVVLVGYRGMDGSVGARLPGGRVGAQALDRLPEREVLPRVADAFRACADRLTDEGVDLAGYSLPQRVDDLEAARNALGYDRIDLVSESAGTRTAMIYSWRYPESIHRSVMIAVNPPGHFVWDAKTTDEQIRRYAALCAEDDVLSEQDADLAASLHSASENMPDNWGFLPVKHGNVKAGAFFGLMSATTDGAGPLRRPGRSTCCSPRTRETPAVRGSMSLLAQIAFPSEQSGATSPRSPGPTPPRLGASTRPTHSGSIIGKPGADLIWAGGQLLDAWPANPDENEYAQVRDSNVETLLIGGNLDFATPPQWATRELLPHLPNGHEVILSDLGHCDDFWTYQPEAADRLINTFLASGRVDRSLYTRNAVDFTPAFSQGNVAKILLGVMLGFAALTVFSLIWMAPPGAQARPLRAQGERRAAVASTRSCSAWAAGSWAC